MVIEIFRAIIPANKLINANSGQHYKIKMGKNKWLQNQASLAIEGFEQIGGFKVPPAELVWNATENGTKFKLILEHFKCQKSFDLANYESTYKYIIDTFTANKYFVDDCWKYAWPVVFNGGDYSVWKERAIRYENDGLPDEIKKDWWIANGANPKTDSFIRILIDTNQTL